MKSPFSTTILVAITLLTFSCKQEPSTSQPSETDRTAESDKAKEYFDAYFEDVLKDSPEYQTYLGIKTDYGKWDDMSPDADDKDLKRNEKYLQLIQDSVNVNVLDESTALSYKLFKQMLEEDIEDYKFRYHDYPVNQMFGAQSRKPAFLINMHRIDSISDAEAYISRLYGFDKMFSQLIASLKVREEKGIIPPKFVFDKVIEDSKNILTGEPFDESGEASALLADFKSKVDKMEISDEDKTRLVDKAKEALLSSLKPAYTSLIAFAEEQKQRATADDGAWKFPEGEVFYNNALKRTTTTDMTAEEIHQVGLSEVERIHNEMNVIKEKTGFEGTLQEFFEFMKNDKQFYYPDTEEGREEYLSKAVQIIDSMKTRLDELFIVKPEADIMVKAVEPFREKSAGKAFYQRPAPDGSRPGIYYANLYNMEGMPTYQMEALAYHEGIPGHHMQLAIQQELEDLPDLENLEVIRLIQKVGGCTPNTYLKKWAFTVTRILILADWLWNYGELAAW